MTRNLFIILAGIGVLGLFLIFFALLREIDSPVTKEISVRPSHVPFKSYISGVGIVEASSENIHIGTPLNRIVKNVQVMPGDKIKKEDILFRLEDSDLEANLVVQLAAYQSSLAKLQKLEAFPRPEDLTEAEAALKNATAELDLAKNEYERIQNLPDPRAISQEEKNRRYYAFQQAQARLQQAQANLEKIKAGSWKPDLDIARLEVKQAEATVDSIKTEISRTFIRSPIDGTVLQVNIHEGEALDALKNPVMIVGNVDEMYLRVSINQLDIPSFQPSAPAVGFLQGDTGNEFPLQFVRLVPFLVNKKTVTNEIAEKVDTRVLQIIYRIKKGDAPIFVGQQMDVFIEAEPFERIKYVQN